MKGIFYTTRSVFGAEGKSVAKHVGILSNVCECIDYLANTKTDSPKKFFLDNGNVVLNKSINFFGDFYASHAIYKKEWSDIYKDLNVECLKEYDKLFIIGGIDLHRSGLNRFGKRVEVFPYDSGQIKWKSTAIHCINILALLKAHHEFGIPLHEIAFDPNEISCNLFHSDVKPTIDYWLYHGYDIPEYSISRLDSLQYYFLKKGLTFFKKDKNIDFTFGYTILEKSNRESFESDVMSLSKKFKNINLYVKNYKTGIDSTIDKDLYLDKLQDSKFTYILPSYNTNCFSVYRLIESIACDCLPLIHPSCNIEDINKSYNIDLNDLMLDTIPSENFRVEKLNYLKDKIMKVECDLK